MIRVAMTGTGGFIGRHVASALVAQGAEVIDVRAMGTYDLLQPDDRVKAMDNLHADIFVHLAWITKHGEFWTSEVNNAWEVATADLVDRFFSNGGRRVVATGSCAEYDWTRGGVFSEHAPLAPHTIYGAAKARTGEALLRSAEEHGASAAWARIFFLFGSGEPSSRLIPSMFHACLKKERMACGPHDIVRDFWDVRNLGEALATLVLSDVSGPINVASGEGTSFEEIGGLIEKITGVHEVIHFNERPLGEGEPRVVIADTTRQQSDLGFKAPIPLETGLSDYNKTLKQTYV